MIVVDSHLFGNKSIFLDVVGVSRALGLISVGRSKFASEVDVAVNFGVDLVWVDVDETCRLGFPLEELNFSFDLDI